MYGVDVEVYPNWCLVLAGDGQDWQQWELGLDRTLDRDDLAAFMARQRTVGFNSLAYDLPIICELLEPSSTPKSIYRLSCELIETGKRTAKPKDWQHADLSEVAPGVRISLKMYGARMHMPRLQDLPLDPHIPITDDQRTLLTDYCRNDVDTTLALARRLEKQLALRASMGRQYGLSLISKSDAQIAEAVLIAEIGHVERPQHIRECQYRPPPWLTYETPELRELMADVLRSTFRIDGNGKMQLPDALKRTLTIGSGEYRLGIGGIHSSEQRRTLRSSADRLLIDIDVASYYPSIILEQELYPPQCGRKFLDVYRSIVERRLEAKRTGDKVTADSLKICVNGSFGKLGSKYSKLYAPDLFKQVTVTGQLALLMLIESLEQAGIAVVSANTDGVVTHPYRHQLDDLRGVVAIWEALTGYSMEETEYAALYSRDVNNYIAVKIDGTVKTKGAYATDGLMVTPRASILVRAVVEHLRDGVPLSDIIGRGDVRGYLIARTVKGGGVWRGEHLGKVVRWYWGMDGEPITYASNGNRVAGSEGAVPMMTLSDELPGDLDVGRYLDEAQSILQDIGAWQPQGSLL